LFASQGYDLRPLLRESSSSDNANDDATITTALAHIWQGRNDRYSELRSSMPVDTTSATTSSKRVEMSYIGG
jgi:cyclic pyranopterin phosphate synthase